MIPRLLIRYCVVVGVSGLLSRRISLSSCMYKCVFFSQWGSILLGRDADRRRCTSGDCCIFCAAPRALHLYLYDFGDRECCTCRDGRVRTTAALLNDMRNDIQIVSPVCVC